MRVFLIDESEYVAALDEEQAMEYYRELVDADEDLLIEEVPSEVWPTIVITDEDNPISYQETGKSSYPQYPLDEYLKQFEADLPTIVAYKL